MEIIHIGLGLNFIAGLGWLIQSIWLYIPKTNPSHRRNVIMRIDKQIAHHKKQLGLNILWLIILCAGFLLQILGS